MIGKRLHIAMRALGWLVCLIGLAAPTVATAQDDPPPFPAPRPNHLGGPGSAEVEIEPQAGIGSAPANASDAVAAVAAPPQDITLSARIAEDGPQIPDGLVWRVFGTQANAEGNLEMVARSEDAVASLSLPPGEYVVHASYGRSQVSDTLMVEQGTASKTLILDAGALRLSSAVAGDHGIDPSHVRFDIYTSGLDDDRVRVATDVAASDIVHLNAGVYNVISRWGNINATVRADLRVEPGQVTDATLYHRATRINWKLVSTEGGEAILDVEWHVEDAEGNEVYSEFGAFPSAVLAEGDYMVVARQNEDVYNREFSVVPGPPREIEILTEVYEAGEQ